MTRKQKEISRRRILQIGSSWTLAGLVGFPRVGSTEEPRTPSTRADPPSRSRVVLIRDQDALDSAGSPNGPVLHEMLNRAVAKLFDQSDPKVAWQQVVQPEDVVGIKSNGWRRLATPTALEEAIRSEVQHVGVAAGDVAVDDQGVRDNPVFRRATALINIRPMRTHHWSGLGTCLKNMIMFVSRPADYHGNSCASLGALWELPEIAGKVQLNILVMLTPQFHSVGPHSFSRDFVWPYRGLIVGTDPVAVDATGARIIAARRRMFFSEDRPISPPPHHIEFADTHYDIGRSKADDIDLIRIGWDEESLI